MRFLNAKDDETEDGAEIKCVPGNTVKCDQCRELADDAIACSDDGVENQGIDGGKKEPHFVVPKEAVDSLRKPVSCSLR